MRALHDTNHRTIYYITYEKCCTLHEYKYIEYQWLSLGICIYTGKVRGRLILVLKPMKVMEKLGWGRAGSGGTSALTPFPRLG